MSLLDYQTPQPKRRHRPWLRLARAMTVVVGPVTLLTGVALFMPFGDRYEQVLGLLIFAATMTVAVWLFAVIGD